MQSHDGSSGTEDGQRYQEPEPLPASRPFGCLFLGQLTELDRSFPSQRSVFGFRRNLDPRHLDRSQIECGWKPWRVVFDLAKNHACFCAGGIRRVGRIRARPALRRWTGAGLCRRTTDVAVKIGTRRAHARRCSSGGGVRSKKAAKRRQAATLRGARSGVEKARQNCVEQELRWTQGRGRAIRTL